jgi:hypothetical protein
VVAAPRNVALNIFTLVCLHCQSRTESIVVHLGSCLCFPMRVDRDRQSNLHRISCNCSGVNQTEVVDSTVKNASLSKETKTLRFSRVKTSDFRHQLLTSTSLSILRRSFVNFMARPPRVPQSLQMIGCCPLCLQRGPAPKNASCGLLNSASLLYLRLKVLVRTIS